MSRDWLVRLADIVRYADDAHGFVTGMTFDDFATDLRTQRAVVYSLLAVGEAVKHVPPAVRERAPQVNWRGAAGFRDRVAHGYAEVRLDAVWQILSIHLPPLRDQAAALLAEADRIDPPPV